jgi:hypothetical protein
MAALRGVGHGLLINIGTQNETFAGPVFDSYPRLSRLQAACFPTDKPFTNIYPVAANIVDVLSQQQS